MPDFLLLFPDIDRPKTGGEIYDKWFLDRLHTRKKCKTLTSNMTGKTGSFFSMVKYLLKIRYFLTFRYIVTNSRFYPRLLPLFILLRLLGFKGQIIMTHHHFNFMTHQGIMRFCHKICELGCLKLSDRLIIPSPYTRDMVRKYCPSVTIEYLELAFDHEKFVCPTTVSEQNNLLFVGTVEPRKGIEYLIEAAEYLKNRNIHFQLNIVGKYSPESRYYRKLSLFLKEKKLESFVTFTGRIAEEELQKLYAEAKVFLFPSRHEGYGMVIMEAMGHGLPVIAFNNSAIPYTVRNGENGFLAKDGNKDDFNLKVFQFLSDKKLQKKLANTAFRTAQNSRTLLELKHEFDSFISLL